MRWLVVAVLLIGCKKKAEEQGPPPPVTAMPADELKRGQDACEGYVTAVCKCAETVEAAKVECTNAKAFPEAITMSTNLMMSSDANPKDSKQAAMTIRATVKSCIEKTAQLPSIGCR